jgi:hypothetical protein
LHPRFEDNRASNQADGAELTGAVAARGTGLKPSIIQSTFQAGLVQHDVANGPKCALLFFLIVPTKHSLCFTLRVAAPTRFLNFVNLSVKKDFGFAPCQLHCITAKKTGLVLNYVGGRLIGGKTAMNGDEQRTPI